jgi:catechol 2,3-dioxygenase-like lactoylglutathione lyase family enzyme
MSGYASCFSLNLIKNAIWPRRRIAELKPRITVITLGVDDLESSLIFYRDGLGFPTEGIVGREFEHGAVAFFDLQAGLKLAIWRREDLAYEAKVAAGSSCPTEFTLGHNVSSKEEVNQVMALAHKAGAEIVDPAHDTFWGGYSGHFQDPDGHLWEVVWNPAWESEERI